MNPDFKSCLEKKRILPFSKGKSLVDKELQTAQEDLDDAQFGLAHNRYKWSTIQGYYSMFHSARALLFSKGYREKSHYCLYAALKELFVKKGELDIEYVDDFRNAMILRENADYRTKFSKSSAEAVLDKSEAFLNSAKKILC